MAVGGDGTVHEVANGLLSSTRTPLPELGVLARGTGDDFVRALASRLRTSTRSPCCATAARGSSTRAG